MLSILNKHAVWCQCVCVIYVVLAIASWSSFQNMTFGVDVFWSVVFSLHSIIIFAAAEHGDILGIKIKHWQFLDNTRLNTIIALQLCTIFDIDILTRLLAIPFLVFAQTKIPPKYYWIGFLCIIFPFRQGLIVGGLATGYGYLCYKIWLLRQALPGQDHTKLRNIYMLKSFNIILSSFMMWGLRCAERFPYKFRWYPIIFGIMGIIAAALHCSYYVAETTTSMNIVIGRSKHLVAASLKAAEKCRHCKQNISALDMEARF